MGAEVTARWRLAGRTSGDTSGEVARVLAKLEAAGDANDLLRLVANSSSAFRPFVLMSAALLVRSPLPAAIREIVILHAAARFDVGFMLREHLEMAREAGVPEDQIGIASCSEADRAGLDDEQRLALRVCDALLDGRALDEGDWQDMVTSWGEEQAVDLLLTIGWWGGMVRTVVRGMEAHGLGVAATTGFEELEEA